MVTITALWLAILVSAALAWIASALVWTVLPHHKKDFEGVPDEEAARNALTGDLAPGQYNIPHVESQEQMKQPEVVKKFDDGPVGFLTVLPKGVPNMGKNMGLSFVYNIFVSIVVAYLASRTLDADASYLSVFRIAGTTAWLAYGTAVIPDAIWFGRPWSAIGKNLGDALLYGLLTAGAFGWLWPGPAA
ncbi:hypothetical protein MJD09_24895 [bacterium]|nr:hypothetical protein [bacterium]